MGLDMYLYNVQKITNSEKQYAESLEDTSDIPFSVILKEEFDANPNMYEDLIPFVEELRLKAKKFERERFCDDFNIPHSAIVIGQMHSDELMAFLFDTNQRVEMSSEQYDSYWVDTTATFYGFRKKEVAYWRKHYDLDDFIKEEIAESKNKTRSDSEPPFMFENCGIYHLDGVLKERIREYLERDDPRVADESFWDDEDANLFYVAWW